MTRLSTYFFSPQPTSIIPQRQLYCIIKFQLACFIGVYDFEAIAILGKFDGIENCSKNSSFYFFVTKQGRIIVFNAKKLYSKQTSAVLVHTITKKRMFNDRS